MNPLIRTCFALFSLCTLFDTSAFATICGSNNVNLNSQADVNNFMAMGCDSIMNNLTIEGANITDLTPLASIKFVGNNLRIRNNGMLSSIDLSGLEEVVGRIDIMEIAMTGIEGDTWCIGRIEFG